MRFWYTQTIHCTDQPNSELLLCGIWNEPDSGLPLIEIRLFDTANDQELVLYSHNPTMMRAEDPVDEDILRKYYPKIRRITETVTKKRFDDLFPRK